MFNRKFISLILCVCMCVSCAVCFAACGASSSVSSEAYGDYAVETEAMDGYALDYAEVDNSLEFEMASEEAYYDEAEFEDVEYEPSGSSVSSGTAGASEVVERKLIRTCNITAETSNFDVVAAEISAKVTQLGGYFESSSVTGTGKNYDYRYGYYNIRIPADNLDEFLTVIGNSSTVTSTSESVEDKTLQYVDMESKIESLRVEQSTLMELLAEAESLDSIIILQERLSEVRYEIESYESQLSVIDNKVTYSTVILTLNEVIEEEEQEEISKRTFVDDIKDAFVSMGENVVDFFKGLVILLIKLIPLFVVSLVIFIVIFAIVKKKRKNRKNSLAKTTDSDVDSSASDPAPSEPES